MRAQRAADLCVRNLELLFAPIGLPFVQKGDGDAATTSVLVRGSAGTGKTTLAVALGHTAARQAKGSALYLTTELGSAEVTFKAGLLGLSESAVRPWDDRADAPAGSLLVQSLPVFVSAQARPTALERGLSAIRAARELCADDDARIRAVVIDALFPPGLASSGDEASLRGDFLGFVHDLEARGVSVIFVEEAEAGAPEHLSFVVDVVLSPSFREDPETGELQRKLACRKSRFALALPGPHDYGLDPESSRPSVWPDTLAVVGANAEPPFAVPKARQARMLVPLDDEGQHMVLQGGSVIINPSDTAGTTFVDALRFTPGVRIVEWRCGHVTTVLTKQKRVEIFAFAGPHALGDAVLRALASASANTVVVHGIEALLEQTRFQAPLLRVIEALRSLGVLTCVHGEARSLRKIEPMADVIVDDSRRGARRMISEPRYRPAALWLLDLTRPDLFSWKRGELAPRGPAEANAVARIHGALARAGEAIRMGDAQLAAREIDEIPRDPGLYAGWPRALTQAAFVTALARYRTGDADVDPLAGLASPPPHPDEEATSLFDELPIELRAPLAWTYALMGRDGLAARACYEACDSEVPLAPTLLSLWWSLNAVHAQSNAAIEALAILRGKPEGRFTLGFYLRALARRGRLDEADSVTEASREAYNLKDYLVARLQADVRLESGEPALIVDAKSRLAALASAESLPVLHRAEVAHNLGYAHERLGELDEASRWYRRALSVNRRLACATQALARLGEGDSLPDAKDGAQSELPFQARG